MNNVYSLFLTVIIAISMIINYSDSQEIKNLKKELLIEQTYSELLLSYQKDLRDSIKKKRIEVHVLTESDIVYAAATVNAECGNQIWEGQLAVAEVIVNRLYNNRHGFKNIAEVVTYPGQFDGVRTKRFHRDPNKTHYLAATTALLGSKLLPETIYYFANECTSTDTPWLRYIDNKRYVSYQDHTFYHK